ncbi:chromosome segregation protein [Niveomyces insectorum RCEF 264]|uniref:Chromosome segregation protein n=1 Tax=Niveomyces insectorum RCEF 264 TaxID=1081102 RepID=A0A167TX08_9HYPO|nr:chromosome segregation protein [Niveomyces insectorum RCEF 264]
MAARPRPRPAHMLGCTRCAYTPNGRQLVTVGSNNTIRVYKTGFDGEPTNVDDCPEQNVAVAATDDFFVVGSEDGTVSLYGLATFAFERFLLRTSLPVRDVALSPDGRWCAVASDELTVRVVGTADNTVVRHLRAHNCPAKHVAFDPRGRTLAVACTDGVVYVYSLTAEDNEDEDKDDNEGGDRRHRGDPPLIRKIDGVISRLASDGAASAQVAWHPDGRAFAAATPTRDIQVVAAHDGAAQRAFAHGHEGPITALAWSPNGALLASAGQDGKLLIWETKTQSVVARHDYRGVLAIAWHPTNNLLSFTNGEGEVYICPDFVAPQYAVLLRLPVQPSPFIHDPRDEAATAATNGLVRRPQQRRGEQATRNGHRNGLVELEADDDDDLMNGLDDGGDEDEDGLGDDDDGFVVDDDGAGYTMSGSNGNRKRPRGAGGAGGDDDDDDDDDPYTALRGIKRVAGIAGGVSGRNGSAGMWRPRYHMPFQPGSTPWRGNRKYLCLNLVGAVWTVDQDAHHTVTVEFYDRAVQRDFHFTDTFGYDKACLDTRGTLFASPPDDGAAGGAATAARAMVFYRPHETWTQQRLDWRTALPRGEAVVALALSASYVTVATTADYVRVYTLHGVPVRVVRPRGTPVVTCAGWRDYVWTLGNGALAPDGTARLQSTIEHVGRGHVCQSEDTVALPAGATVRSVFFSDEGDPCIYDSTGTLLTLLHWRQPGRAAWVPLLDTTRLSRLADGRKHESYFPVAVADGKFHCIILKGGDRYPYFPRPLLSEFAFSVPLGGVSGAGDGDDNDEDRGNAINGDHDDHDDDDDEHGQGGRRTEAAEARRLEQALVLQGVRAAQLRDRLTEAETETETGTGTGTDELARHRMRKLHYRRQTALARLELETDKTLLQLLARECRAGEERGMRALELVRLMRDGSGKMVEAAGKVAERYGRTVLGAKIRALGERQMQARLGLGADAEAGDGDGDGDWDDVDDDDNLV